MNSYSNATLADKLTILDDLEFLLHQYDNARDFVAVGGLEAIVANALNESNEGKLSHFYKK